MESNRCIIHTIKYTMFILIFFLKDCLSGNIQLFTFRCLATFVQRMSSCTSQPLAALAVVLLATYTPKFCFLQLTSHLNAFLREMSWTTVGQLVKNGQERMKICCKAQSCEKYRGCVVKGRVVALYPLIL